MDYTYLSELIATGKRAFTVDLIKAQSFTAMMSTMSPFDMRTDG